MKLDSQKYKLTVFSENGCPDCEELKKILSENKIPFMVKSITVENDENGKPKRTSAEADNRWEFLDISRDIPAIGYVPLIEIEDNVGVKVYRSLAIPDLVIPEELKEYFFDDSKDALKALQPYFIS